MAAARVVPSGLGGADGSAGTLESLAGRSVLAVSGIARPESFRASLESLGANVADHLAFRDHVGYTARDAAAIAQRANELGVQHVITTTKDMVRWPQGAPAPLTLEIGLEIGAEAPLLAWLAERLGARR